MGISLIGDLGISHDDYECIDDIAWYPQAWWLSNLIRSSSSLQSVHRQKQEN
jgi:hypothetical protein